MTELANRREEEPEVTARDVLVSAVAVELAQPADQKPQNAFQRGVANWARSKEKPVIEIRTAEASTSISLGDYFYRAVA